MKFSHYSKFSILLFFITVLQLNNLYAQINEKVVLDAYKDFGTSTREVVFVHINKSVFIKNEMLGFNAYVLDKAKKKSIAITRNLYYTITNNKDEIVKQELVKVEEGLSYNTVKIDSLFTSGVYKFRAYTNWMLNFNEHNFYEHSFFVINPKIKEEIKNIPQDTIYNIQVLPEGGHFVSEVKNNIGVIVKNTLGFGLENATGKIIDANNTVITAFKLNQFGIGKTSITPSFNENYRVVVEKGTKKISQDISNIKTTGIAFSVVRLRNKVGLSFKINNETKEIVKDKKYFVAIHNGNKLKTAPFQFNEKTEVVKIINNTELYSGINIFTVFDAEKNKPILERMYFNYEGISKTEIASVATSIENDSVTINMRLKDIVDLEKIQNLSISVLPNSTESYNFNSNILSQLYLESHVKGFVQDAAYYFTNENAKTKYDLDNLLITQGWSSYFWNDIFRKPVFSYKYEQGINVVSNINGSASPGYLVYPLKNSKTEIFKPTKKDKAFTQTNLFPIDNEVYKVSLLKSNNKAQKPNLYLQFYPAKIPALSVDSYTIPFKNTTLNDEIKNFDFSFKNSDEALMLAEVVVVSKIDATRKDKIKNRSRGNIDFFDESNYKPGETLASYLSGRGFRANDFSGQLVIINPNPNSPNNNIPLVILDDVQLTDFSFLTNFQMNTVDYIEINKAGVGYGIRGGGGVIKIVTDPIKRRNQNTSARDGASIYPFPLTFSSPKKYYAPVYTSYNSKFFKQYGTLSWFPNLKVNKKGVATFKILNTFTKAINLYIEGVLNDGTFISETKTIFPLD